MLTILAAAAAVPGDADVTFWPAGFADAADDAIRCNLRRSWR